MLITIQVNNKKIKAEKGETILSALSRNGIIIPTLCRMKEFTPTGACRMCVVEVEGRERLVTACSQPVEEWMKIWTHSPRVISARRTIVELLLSNHPDDCLYCDRNLNCELQRLAESLNIRERRIKGRKIKPRLDQSSPAIVRELAKCILCGRCVRVCEEVVTATSLDFINRGRQTHIGAAMDRDLNFSSCIQCGQCVLVCPTAALHEKHSITEVQEYLSKSEVLKVIQYSPLAAQGVAEELGMKYSRDFDMVLNCVLRKIGFDKVYNTGTGTDIVITEIAEQVYENLETGSRVPLYLTACPAWVKYAEQFTPYLIPQLSTIKPPQQIVGALIKTVVANDLNLRPEKIFSVAVSPCTAMKYEARRDGMTRKGISDVDSVMTVRELVRLIKIFGVDVASSDRETADEPFNVRSSSAVITEVSGGFTEAVLRLIYFRLVKSEPDRQALKKLRLSGDFREIDFRAGKYEIKAAVVDGLTGLEKLRASLEKGIEYDMIEVMVCQGGCIHGGGMPFISSRDDLKIRSKTVYQADESDAVTIPSKSPALLKLYDRIRKEDIKFEGKSVFNTHFEKRNVLL